VKVAALIRTAVLASLLALPAWAAPPRHFDAHRPPAPQPAAAAVGVDAAGVRCFTLTGPHGQRYRIQVARLGPLPEGGYPVLYLLDGNAAMATLTAAREAPPLAGSVLLVAVGYDTDAYFDTDARSLDYTPPLPDGRPAFDPRVPGRRGGGADAFLDFLAGRLMPRIRADWPVAPSAPGIWGHSYGGLLVLHALFERPGLFGFHAAASPSLWWHAPLMQRAAADFAARGGHGQIRLLLMRGGAERRRGGGPGAKRDAVTLEAMARTLSVVPGLEVALRRLDGLRHGAMFSASLGPAIRAFARMHAKAGA